MGQALRRAGASFKAYDLRHAWAVRAIHTPEISPSLAAKSMGHSLAVHQRHYVWAVEDTVFDAFSA